LQTQLLKLVATNDAGQTLKALIQGILDEKLNRRKRVESADYRVCAAHDLAPVFERCFGIKPKDLQRDKLFVKCLEKNGLAFDENAVARGRIKTGIKVNVEEKGKKRGKLLGSK